MNGMFTITQHLSMNERHRFFESENDVDTALRQPLQRGHHTLEALGGVRMDTRDGTHTG